MSPLWVSWTALFTGPLAGVAWGYRRTATAFFLSNPLLTVMLIADVILLGNGTSDVGRVWRLVPDLLILWTTAWVYGQVLAVAALVAAVFPR